MILPYCKSLDEGLKISFLIPNKCKFCGRKSSKHCTSHPHTHSTNSYWAPTCGKCLGAILRCSEQDNISPSLRELIETTEGILRMDIDHFILFLSFGRSPEGYRPQKKLCQKKKNVFIWLCQVLVVACRIFTRHLGSFIAVHRFLSSCRAQA